jgi:hypothetical protein
MRYLGVPTLAQETGTKGGCFVPGFHLVDACGQPRCYMLHVTTGPLCDLSGEPHASCRARDKILLELLNTPPVETRHRR